METEIQKITDEHQQQQTRKGRLLNLIVKVVSHSRFGSLESF